MCEKTRRMAPASASATMTTVPGVTIVGGVGESGNPRFLVYRRWWTRLRVPVTRYALCFRWTCRMRKRSFFAASRWERARLLKLREDRGLGEFLSTHGDGVVTSHPGGEREG